MTSPINTNRPRDIGIGDSKKTGSSEGPQNGTAASNLPTNEFGASDSAKISTSDRLQTAQKALEGTPEVNLQKVEEIKERIANGDYPIDASRIAEKMVALEKLLG